MEFSEAAGFSKTANGRFTLPQRFRKVEKISQNLQMPGSYISPFRIKQSQKKSHHPAGQLLYYFVRNSKTRK
jgi:hypothetical protein